MVIYTYFCNLLNYNLFSKLGNSLNVQHGIKKNIVDGKAYQMFAIFFLVILPLQKDTSHHYSYN